MQRALTLARRGQGSVEPNPMVGCVIVKDGVCIAEGYHRQFGKAHAEVEALGTLSQPQDARGATAYVTLEPCCHTGKTPPCTEALIAAGITRVVVAMKDPFPRVDGGGLHQLERSGMQVHVGIMRSAAEELNAPYLKRLSTGRPWVIAKWAMSIDGKIATSTGDSQWISNELSRAEVHRLRGRMDAIIVGGGTAIADDPTLTSRPPGQRIATRIVIAGKRLPSLQSKLVQTIRQAPLLIVTNESSDPSHLHELEKVDVEILRLPGLSRGEQILALLDEIGKRPFTNVMVEGGAEVLGSFAEADQLDEIHAYVCPKLIGGKTAPGPLGGNGIQSLALANPFIRTEVAMFDCDLRISLRRCR
jgi:diaminohydroxyphosphoribosylaminopyrimidine deaminase / 5-amino-6-(5-phosphoribosylamino)uracil reductase